MTPDEIDEFLAGPWIGAIGALRADGSPAIAPVWYRWHNGKITVWGDSTTWWIKRLQTEPRVAFSVFEHEAPFRAIYMRGTAQVRYASVDELLPEIVPITARYTGDGDPVARTRSYDDGTPKAFVTVTPPAVKGIRHG